ALADGRLHLSAVILLAPHLTSENARELVAAAAHANKLEIEVMLARRFPKADLPARIQVSPDPAHAPGPVENIGEFAKSDPGVAPDPMFPVLAQASGGVAPSQLRSRMTPLAPQRYGYQFSNDEEFQADLTEAMELLGNAVAPGDLAQVFKRVLKAALPVLRQQKFGATTKPRRCRSPRPGSRTIPASVKRAVWKRDGGQCTFVSDDGRRCTSRRVQFDHIQEIARGGLATPSNLRLLCARITNTPPSRPTAPDSCWPSARQPAVVRSLTRVRSQGAWRPPRPPLPPRLPLSPVLPLPLPRPPPSPRWSRPAPVQKKWRPTCEHSGSESTRCAMR